MVKKTDGAVASENRVTILEKALRRLLKSHGETQWSRNPMAIAFNGGPESVHVHCSCSACKNARKVLNIKVKGPFKDLHAQA